MTIYDQALQAIKNNELSAELYASATRRVFLKQINGNIKLIYQELDAGGLVRKTEMVEVAIYMPNRGNWIFTLDRDTYERWVRRTGNGFAVAPESVFNAETLAMMKRHGVDAFKAAQTRAKLVAANRAADQARAAAWEHPIQSWDNEEYRNLPPDADALAEQREHDATRVAPRHPDQPYYQAWRMVPQE